MNYPANILIVEDSKSHSEFINSGLDKNKYNIQNAYSGEEAIGILLKQDCRINIVVTDYHLPGINGIDLIKTIKDKKSQINFIFLTVDQSIDTVVKAMKAGASDFIVKSIDLINELQEKLDKIYASLQLEKLNIDINNNISILSAAVEQSGSTIVITDLEGNIEYVNKKFTLATGYTFDEVKGKNPRVLKSGDKSNEFYKNLWNTILNGNSWKGEFINKKKNGDLYYEEAIISPVKNNDGEIIKFMAVKDDITTRKIVEEAYEKNREYLQAIYNAIPELIYVIDETYTFFDVIENNTPKLTDNHTGIYEKTTSDIFSDTISDLINQKIDKALQTNESQNFVYELNSINEKKWYEAVIAPLKYKLYSKSCVILIIRDITERKISEEAIKFSENRFRMLFENSLDGFLLLESIKDENNQIIDFKVLECNSAASGFLNIHHKDVIGKLVSKYNLEGNQKAIHYYAQVLNTGLPIRYESFSNSLNKHFRVIIYCPQENQAAIIFEDISQRKKNELAIAESEKKFRLIVEMLGEGLGLVDTNELFIFANPAAEKIFEVNKGELLGKSVAEFVEKEEFEKIKKQTQLRSSGIESKYDVKIRTRNGNEKNLMLTATPNFDSSGNFIGSYGIFRDITERIKIEKQLKELNATKDKFFSIIAHDLKNPFNTLLGFSDLLIKNIEKYDSSRIKNYLEIIKNSSRNAYELLENLLIWSKSQTGRIDFNPEVFDLKTLVFSNIELIKPHAARKDINITTSFTDEMIVFGDTNMLNSVMRNLLTNAVKFTNQHGWIKIELFEKSDVIEVNVIDNGVGIPSDKMDKLFRIDTKISTYGTADEKGTGLGLILCKEFIEKHSGKIKVESKVGEGSKFSFTLPLMINLSK